MARSDALMPPGPAPTMQTSRAPLAGRRPAPLQPGRDRIDALPALVDRVLDQGQAAQLAHHEQVGHVGLELARKTGQVGGDAGVRHHDLDRTHRADFRTEAVADALVAVHDRRLAGDHGQHVALGADFDARSAPDAVRDVDMRVLSPRTLARESGPFRGRHGGPLLPPHASQRGQDRHAHEERERDVDQCAVHRGFEDLALPPAVAERGRCSAMRQRSCDPTVCAGPK